MVQQPMMLTVVVGLVAVVVMATNAMPRSEMQTRARMRTRTPTTRLPPRRLVHPLKGPSPRFRGRPPRRHPPFHSRRHPPLHPRRRRHRHLGRPRKPLPRGINQRKIHPHPIPPTRHPPRQILEHVKVARGIPPIYQVAPQQPRRGSEREESRFGLRYSSDDRACRLRKLWSGRGGVEEGLVEGEGGEEGGEDGLKARCELG